MTFIFDPSHDGDNLKKLSTYFEKSYQIRSYDDTDIPTHGFYMGTIEGAHIIQKIRPNVKMFFSPERWACSIYYSYVNEKLLNDDHAFFSFHGIPHQKWDIYRWFGKECKVFIRPDSSEKVFPAQLIDIQDIDRFVEDHSDYEGLAVISTPKEIFGEWRFLIHKNYIKSVSSYRVLEYNTEVPSAPKKVRKFLDDFLIQTEIIEDVIYIDVALQTNGECGIVEITPFSTAGMYKNDKLIIAQIIKELEYMA